MKNIGRVTNSYNFHSPSLKRGRMQNPQDTNWAGLDWSAWVNFESPISTYQTHISNKAGVYRVRSPQSNELIYIGQTGRNLRERVRALVKHVLRPQQDPPWNDPHTAAPVLWAYKNENQFHYEVSVAHLEVPYTQRQCFEDYLLHLHRNHYNRSTLANFGHSHPLWSRPSNKKQNRPMMKNGSTKLQTSLPRAINATVFHSNTWLGLHWQKHALTQTMNVPDLPGIYRFVTAEGLAYCGESLSLRKRLSTHSKNSNFKNTNCLYSVMPDAEPHHLKEREVDMIGAYYAITSQSPTYQYTNGR
ncbi:GIY-YIG nuclease family protein [bacterium]|nr:GIY-YIG nuclease family protein [bacterium]